MANRAETPSGRGLPPSSADRSQRGEPNGGLDPLFGDDLERGSRCRRGRTVTCRRRAADQAGDGATASAAAHAAGIVGEHEVGDAGHDLGAEARAVEYAVVTHGGLQPMRLAMVRYVDAERVRYLGLADAGNVVVLALHGKQGDAADIGGIDADAAMGHLALG